MWKTDSDLTVGHFRGTLQKRYILSISSANKMHTASDDTFTEIVADGDMCATHAAQMLKKRRGATVLTQK